MDKLFDIRYRSFLINKNGKISYKMGTLLSLRRFRLGKLRIYPDIDRFEAIRKRGSGKIGFSREYLYFRESI